MKNNVHTIFHRKKGQLHALALLLALLVAVLCGCNGQKAKDNASTQKPAGERLSDTVESAGEPLSDTVESAGEPLSDAGEPPEWEFSAQAEEGGAQEPEGDFPAEPPMPPANNEVTITLSGMSSIINEINTKVQMFDDRLAQISNALNMSNKTKGGVSTPVLIVSLLVICALSVGLTAAIVIHSFNRKFKKLEEQIREQRVATNQQTKDLQAAISQVDSQEALKALVGAIRQYTDTVNTSKQGIPKAQTVPTIKSTPTKAYYQVFQPRSSADMPTLDKSETHQPIVGWVSSGTLFLEPALNNAGQCSRDNLYSEQMMACFNIQPPEAGNADFYTVTVDENAKAVYKNGQYVLSTQGRLTARK